MDKILVETEELTGTVVRGCSVKKVFLKIHRKITVLESFLNEVSDLENCNFIKKLLQHRCFLVDFAKF